MSSIVSYLSSFVSTIHNDSEEEKPEQPEAEEQQQEEEEEEEPEDIHPVIREECKEKKCAQLAKHFEHCQEKVQSGQGFKGEDCVEELRDYLVVHSTQIPLGNLLIDSTCRTQRPPSTNMAHSPRKEVNVTLLPFLINAREAVAVAECISPWLPKSHYEYCPSKLRGRKYPEILLMKRSSASGFVLSLTTFEGVTGLAQVNWRLAMKGVCRAQCQASPVVFARDVFNRYDIPGGETEEAKLSGARKTHEESINLLPIPGRGLHDGYEEEIGGDVGQGKSLIAYARGMLAGMQILKTWLNHGNSLSRRFLQILPSSPARTRQRGHRVHSNPRLQHVSPAVRFPSTLKMSTAPGPIPNPVVSTFAFIGFIGCVVPFPWHLEAWNTGTCLYMFWAGLGCLNVFVNSIVWNGNAINWAPIWCDISSRIVLGCNFAIPAAALCISRRLYRIASVRAVVISRAEKRRAVVVDLALGLGYPCLMIALQYIVQGHRFNIFKDIGCMPFTYNTPPAFVLIHAQPLIVGLISGIYSALSVRLFWKRHARFNELLSHYRNLNTSRYVRLMSLASIDIITTIPLASWAFCNNIRQGTYPWLGWNDTHFGFSRIDRVPAMFWRRDPLNVSGFEFTRWMPVVCAAVFFAFFGFADEARKNYRLAVRAISRKMGFLTSNPAGSRTGLGGAMRPQIDVGGTSSRDTASVDEIKPAVPPTETHSNMIARPSFNSRVNFSISFRDAVHENTTDGPDIVDISSDDSLSSSRSSKNSEPSSSLAPDSALSPRPAYENQFSKVSDHSAV
ncbi:hypothetical protein NMY22_g11694 [Coprinellus aureogranulatus]|nr:hypothetical protein NMY22_g11694 [Coprinellus aureogranulatus]